jgi:hypothetical protein
VDSSRHKDYYKRNRDKVLAYKKDWSVTNADEVRGRQLKHKYWPDCHWMEALERYRDLVRQTKNCCAICHVPAQSDKQLAVDHNHRTGKVRGILCSRCNTSLGFVDDNIVLLENMISYLKTDGI